MVVDLRKKGIGLAIIIAIIVPLALGLMFYPAAHMELKGMPFGILSLDEDVNGINMGDQLVESIESGDLASVQSETTGEDAAEADTSIADVLSFSIYDTQEELDQALHNNELYGAFVISSDFTKGRMAAMAAQQMSSDPSAVAAPTAQQGMAVPEGADASTAQQMAAAAAAASAASHTAEEAEPTITVILDYAKSPIIATQLESHLSGTLSSLGLEATIDVIDQGPVAEAESASMLSGMFSQMMVIMPMLICSMLAGALAVIGFAVRAAASMVDRMRRLALAIVVDAVAALAVALMTYWLLACVAGIPADLGSYLGFVWLTSFFLMVFFSGCACFRGRAAIAMGGIIILLGMTTGYLPYEGLPALWQDWVCPWAPQYYLGNGLREVMFAEESIWNQGTAICGIYAIIGIVLAPLGLAVSAKMNAKQKAMDS